MDIILDRHHLIDGLFVINSGCLRIYFQYVGYDSSEQHLVFERNDEVVTGRIFIDNEAQLDEWKQAFDAMNIVLEHLDD